MATIPDNVPEIPEVPGFQESAYKGLKTLSEPGKLREWYVGRLDRDTQPLACLKILQRSAGHRGSWGREDIAQTSTGNLGVRETM